MQKEQAYSALDDLQENTSVHHCCYKNHV